MPVRDLAPALLALGELFTEASTVLHPDHAAVALNIRATRDGSFDVNLVLHGSDIWNALGLLGNDPLGTLVSLKELVIGEGGLFDFIRWLRRRPIASEEHLDPGSVRVTSKDGSSIEIPTQVLALYRRVRIRRQANEVVQPLGQSGI